MSDFSYVGWRVQDGMAKRIMPGGEAMQVELQPNHGVVLLEGWWGNAVLPDKPVGVSGLCLWDARWQVEFVPQGKGSSKRPAPRRSLALPGDRTDVFQRLAAGQRIARIFLPPGPGVYHEQMLRWQADQIKLLGLERLLYHMPLAEYCVYIRELIDVVGVDVVQQLEGMLTRYVDQLLRMQASIFGTSMDLVQYVRPLECGAGTVHESWAYPYLHPEAFGASSGQLVGVEDLNELRVLHEVRERTGREVPTRVAVLAEKHPYVDRTLRGDEVVINLS